MAARERSKKWREDNPERYKKQMQDYQKKNAAQLKKYQHKYYMSHKEKAKEARNRSNQKKREWYINYKKTQKCKCCGENRWQTLDFHHRKGTKKIRMVSSMIINCSMRSVLQEIEKCDVLCANCHAMKSFKGRNDPHLIYKWYREYKEKQKCTICDEKRSACLSFHHEDPENKIEHIAHMMRDGFSKKNIQKEIEKCIVLCQNCHRIEHYNIRRRENNDKER